jgi:hypothetical protein
MYWQLCGSIGSVLGGAVTHMFSRPRNERFHPGGLIFSTLGATLVLFICYKLNIHFPAIWRRNSMGETKPPFSISWS